MSHIVECANDRVRVCMCTKEWVDDGAHVVALGCSIVLFFKLKQETSMQAIGESGSSLPRTSMGLRT